MAKEQKKEPDPPPVPEVPEAAGPPKSYRLYIALGFVSLILFQMIVLGLLLSLIAQQPAKRPGLEQGNCYDDTVGPPTDVIRTVDTEEITIGDRNTFKFRFPRENDSNESFAFLMTVVVAKSDASKFTTRYDACKNEVAFTVSSVLRASTPEERLEPSHTTIRARVQKEVNTVLRTSWVLTVYFTEVNHEIN